MARKRMHPIHPFNVADEDLSLKLTHYFFNERNLTNKVERFQGKKREDDHKVFGALIKQVKSLEPGGWLYALQTTLLRDHHAALIRFQLQEAGFTPAQGYFVRVKKVSGKWKSPVRRETGLSTGRYILITCQGLVI